MKMRAAGMRFPLGSRPTRAVIAGSATARRSNLPQASHPFLREVATTRVARLARTGVGWIHSDAAPFSWQRGNLPQERRLRLREIAAAPLRAPHNDRESQLRPRSSTSF